MPELASSGLPADYAAHGALIDKSPLKIVQIGDSVQFDDADGAPHAHVAHSFHTETGAKPARQPGDLTLAPASAGALEMTIAVTPSFSNKRPS